MIYMTGNDGELHIVVLETENLDELKKGRPARSPDGKVVIAWTPDPAWLTEQIRNSGGDPKKIAQAIDECAKRPQKDRPPDTGHYEQFNL